MDGRRAREVWRGAAEAAAAPDPAWLRPGVPTFAGVPAARRAEELAGAAVAVVGIPYERRGCAGVADGPAAVRRASLAYAAALHGGTLPEADRDLVPAARLRVVDYGDVVLDGAGAAGVARAAMAACAHERLIEVAAAGAVPLVLGGEPAVATPVLEVLSGRVTGKLGIVAFGPTLGLVDETGWGGCWRRAFELGVVEPDAFVQIGVRAAATAAEAAVAAALGHRWYTLSDVDEAGVEVVAQEALEAATRGTESVFLALDGGVLEPPAGGASEPGGLTVRELLRALRRVARAPLGAVGVTGVSRGAPEAARAAARAAVEVVVGLAQQFPEGQGADAGTP